MRERLIWYLTERKRGQIPNKTFTSFVQTVCNETMCSILFTTHEMCVFGEKLTGFGTSRAQTETGFSLRLRMNIE